MSPPHVYMNSPMYIGGWGERAPSDPNREIVSSRPCVRACVRATSRAKIKWGGRDCWSQAFWGRCPRRGALRLQSGTRGDLDSRYRHSAKTLVLATWLWDPPPLFGPEFLAAEKSRHSMVQKYEFAMCAFLRPRAAILY